MTAPHVPAWKRLGLKLKFAKDTPEDYTKTPAAGASTRDVSLPAQLHLSTVPASRERTTHSAAHSNKRPTEDLYHGGNIGDVKRRKVSTAQNPEVQGDGHSLSSTGDSASDPTFEPRQTSNAATVPVAAATKPRPQTLKEKLKEKKKKAKSGFQDPVNRSAAASGLSASVPPTRGAQPPDPDTTPAPKRRKSVAFTPETKIEDGDSAQNLFKAWVAEQNGPDAEFTSAEVAEFEPPPVLHPANEATTKNETPAKKERRLKKSKQKKSTEQEAVDGSVQDVLHSTPQIIPATLPETSAQAKKVKKDQEAESHSTAQAKDLSSYTEYLRQYSEDRAGWKFNKAKQTDLLKNIWNLYRVPSSYDQALSDYLSGLQGQAAQTRLREAALNTIKDSGKVDEKWGENTKNVAEDTEPSKEVSGEMEDPAAREQAHDEALRRRLRESKARRKGEAVKEDQQSEEVAQKLQKRKRAEMILRSLKAVNTPSHTPTESSQNPRSSGEVGVNGKPLTKGYHTGLGKRIVFDDADEPPRKRARRRKVRTGVPDDDDSSSSDSDASIPSVATNSDSNENDEDESSRETSSGSSSDASGGDSSSDETSTSEDEDEGDSDDPRDD
ncbi:hypothetical protein B0A49_10066 [Cryomyces minteri]|uniref:WKF domain-containing protein n=1 Tax=Cryomyces minteri TaxID=331657 RepID=A0A4V5ND92_9PEZI|nr:hypothetical protein B0A49_10066 [Cryomyces minteri]